MKNILKFFVIFSFLILFATRLYADGTHLQGIQLDGTIGTAGKPDLPGPDYEIKAEFGKRAGANLFHSFRQFNIHQGESATFTGPDSVQNIISRVTGGNASWIDGRLASAIPNADLYFLNPAGVMFGPNASLDLQGSFHVSTADYLLLGEGGRFDARNPGDSILTVAPVESFGFLTDTPAPIQATDSQLAVLPGKTLSLTGGDLNLGNSQTPTYDEAGHPAFTHQFLAPGGQILLDAKGAVSLKNSGVDAGGLSGGQISIRADSLEMNDSRISSHTFGDTDGQGIDIQADNLSMQDSDIIANTYGAGRGSDIRLDVDENLTATRLDRPLGVEFGFSLLGASHISTMTAGQGDIGASGDIYIDAGNIALRDAAEIRTRSFSQGKSGNVTLRVDGDFQAAGVIPLSRESMPVIGGVNTFGFAGGDSGDIDVTARNILLDKGGQINASTMYSAGGSVSVRADTIRIENEAELAGIPSAICSITIGTGEAGRIDVEALQMTLENGGMITTATTLYGNADEMTVRVSDTLTLSGAAKRPFQLLGFPEIPYVSFIGPVSADMSAEGGQGSNVYVEAGHIVLNGGAGISAMTFGGGDAGSMEVVAETINISGWHNNGILYRSGISGASNSSEPYSGQAGNIDVTAKTITIDDSGAVSTSAVNAGGGNISIHAGEMIYLSDQGAVITSVQSGVGDGGNISVENPQFIVTNKGEIKAQADEGRGGNIDIAAENFLRSADSVVSASSRLGIGGNVSIKAPDTNISGGLTLMPGGFLDAAKWAVTPCRQRSGENLSRFVFEGRDATPLSFDDWQPSPATELLDLK